MPPKRKSTESVSANEGSKRPRPEESPDASDILPNPRYTEGSITSFYDVVYKKLLRDPKEAFALISLCEWLFVDECFDNDEGEDPEQESETEVKRCQDPCVCRKPASDNPNHPYVLSNAGFKKAAIVEFLMNVRNPWSFSLHTFNGHESYGVLELLENLVLDFDEEEGNWKNQWAICETIAYLFMRGALEPMFHVDDSRCLFEFCRLVQIMFLTMLATLERQDLLGPDTEVKNLAVVMGMYVLLAAEIGSENSKLSKTRHASNIIMAYAAKYGFTPRSPRDLVKELASRKIKSPRLTIPSPTYRKNDPWNWKETLDDYKAYFRRPVYAFKGGPVGGDRLDMTSWKPEERAKYCFSKPEDPLTQTALDALKKGQMLPFIWWNPSPEIVDS
ncbi:hypothetical protein N7540_012736 [Penicillium herquei]|nr:hypothetical protein N7540_012736 [Penicillium herquei]